MKNEKHPEYQYLNLLRDILDNGTDKPIFGVEGVNLRSVFGRQIRFDLSDGFPLLTTKKVFLRGVIEELLWFLRGDSNVKYLVDKDVHIWDEWAYKPYKKAMDGGKVPSLSQDDFISKIKEDNKFAKKWGELGPVYGVQWRKWPAKDGRKIDQLAWAIEKLKTTPERKSIVVSAWNPEYLYEMALPGESMVIAPCHMMYQFNVNDNKLSMNMYIRSQDSFLGAPFNFASYALLLMMVAQITGFEVGEYVHTFGDVHIYSNHFDAVKEQLEREPRPFPRMKLNPKIKNIDDFKYEDFEISGYKPHPQIKAPITLVGGF
ncbi:MAG: Thymidylate synthase [bacterium ADurb.Bin212]|nr:MAG: Thymidylate synthase [bacterium ADurb.Bin212]